MKLFCYLDSSGDIEHSNLQLYSLKQASRCWNELVSDLSVYSDTAIKDLKERLVFILNCFGLSLSQLLGQNWPSENQEKMDGISSLLSNILKSSYIKKEDKTRLNRGIREIRRVYGAIRHFGKVQDNKNYGIVDGLDLKDLERYRKITIDIWDTVIAIQRSLDLNEIENFGSIADQVKFHELPDLHKTRDGKDIIAPGEEH